MRPIAFIAEPAADTMAAARAFGEVVKYATAARCRRAVLLQHFGETLRSGRRTTCCDVCANVEAVQLQVPPPAAAIPSPPLPALTHFEPGDPPAR